MGVINVEKSRDCEHMYEIITFLSRRDDLSSEADVAAAVYRNDPGSNPELTLTALQINVQ